jgi:hypothetical protein
MPRHKIEDPFGYANEGWFIDLGWEAKHKRKRIKIKVDYKIYHTESVFYKHAIKNKRRKRLIIRASVQQQKSTNSGKQLTPQAATNSAHGNKNDSR